MKPYYQDNAVTIFHGDCREILPHLEPVDLVLTDPPYGVELTTKSNDYRHSEFFDNGESLRASVLYDDEPQVIRLLIQQVSRLLLGMSKRMLIFCGPAMMFVYPEPTAIGCVFSISGAGRSPWGFQCMHPILFYGKDPFLADGKGCQPNSFQTVQPNRDDVDHPCPKPLPWMKWAVWRASREDETILDPFMGSGTTLRAAKDFGRKAIGIEIEEKYCEIAARRMAQEVLDLAI